MAKQIFAPRGTTDILPIEMPIWQGIESKARRILNNYNYKELRTPLFEETGLFKRSLGQTSDVVNKQLLELASDKKESFSLRPEGTASVVRAYVENRLDKKETISKLFYIGPMFRGERPQRGRLRQFHQIGVEVIGPGAFHPYLDAEIVALNVFLLQIFGLTNFKLKLNTLGSLKDKENFSKHLRKLLNEKMSDLCDDCQQRFDRNVFRILDCKNKSCQSVIQSIKINHDYLTEEGRSYFEKVTQALDGLGVNYEVCYDLVRGLDYYTHTVFEIAGSSLGSQDALSAGGRYNHLVSQLGGPDVPAMGFALGIERVILSMPKERVFAVEPLKVYILALEERFLGKIFKTLEMLRAGGISCDMGYQVSSMKSQMRLANKSGAIAVLIFGDEEEKKDMITLKYMVTGEQKKVSMNDLIAEIEKLIERADR